jgi:hypothetical protein
MDFADWKASTTSCHVRYSTTALAARRHVTWLFSVRIIARKSVKTEIKKDKCVIRDNIWHQFSLI